MRDLIQCSAIRSDFKEWLDAGTASSAVWQDKEADTMFLRLEKKPSVDYLYRAAIKQDHAISWDDGLTFCGVYDTNRQTLYLTRDSLYSLMCGRIPLITETGPSMVKTISVKINQRVEDIIANDRNNLPIHELTDWQAVHDLESYQTYGAKEDAIQALFADEKPDGQLHSRYWLNELPEAAFIAYIADPELLIQTEAEQYIKKDQERFLLQFLKNDTLLAEYQALVQDIGNPIHRMKAITDAVRGCGAKTVTVTVQKDGQELIFKTTADSLKGHRGYSTYDIPAPDRREFERLFGRYANYTPEDITKITYGRNTIYEAPLVQSEELGQTMQMGGM